MRSRDRRLDLVGDVQDQVGDVDGLPGLPDDRDRSRYDYAAPAFEFRAVLLYDEAGLILDYPGLATRFA